LESKNFRREKIKLWHKVGNRIFAQQKKYKKVSSETEAKVWSKMV
jgi:hypothetical protein